MIKINAINEFKIAVQIVYLFEFLCFANVRMSSCLAEYKYVMERREIREL